MYSIEEFDKAKTQVLKYILYQKRCEQEIRTKFLNKIDENMLEDIIEYLKEAGYINDNEYIESKIYNFKSLKNLSIREVKYKLLSKGIDKNYIDSHIDEMNEYEIKSASNIINKKIINLQIEEIKSYLYKKGYKSDNINEAIDNIE